MTLRHRSTLRSVSTTAVLGLAASTAVVLGTAGTASAATISFDCTTPIGAKTFSVVVTANAPAQVPTGTSVTPTVTSVMTIPEDLAGLMRFISTDEISGTIQTTTVVDGVEVPTTITIPRTDIGDSGPAVLTGTGTLPAIAAGPAGTVHRIAAGPQDVAMTLIDTDADPDAETPQAVTCTPTAGQSTVFSTFTSSATSSTALKAKYAKKSHKATITATVNAPGVDPSGTVTVKVKHGKSVKTKTVPVVGGKAKAVFKKLTKKGKYKVTASYSGAAAASASTAKTTFKVR